MISLLHTPIFFQKDFPKKDKYFLFTDKNEEFTTTILFTGKPTYRGTGQFINGKVDTGQLNTCKMDTRQVDI